jgi:SAM-dependent methyltransferase
MSIDAQKVEEFATEVVSKLAGAWAISSIHLGDRLGLYRGMLEGPATAEELAERTGCHPRLVGEWLAGQAALGHVVGDDDLAGTYHLPAEHAAVLAVEDSPVYLAPATAVIAAATRNQDRIDEAFRTDGAVPWGEQHSSLFAAVDRFFGTTYRSALVSQWLPALDGVDERLAGGGRVLDVGCGLGTATVLLAEAYPAATVVGVDIHQPSLDEGAKRAADAGVSDRVTFVAGSATDYGGGPYDLICFFDSLHDMGDPLGAVVHARRQLAPGGTVLAVEPMAAESPAEAAQSPAAQLYYPSSAVLCTPHAVSEGGIGFGNQVPEHTWRDVFGQAGFGHFRRATETPFNRVFEARA